MTAFINNVLKLVSGNIIAQIVGIILIPVITRVYTPEDYGVLQLFISISSIITIFSCLSYQLAIMLPKEDEESINIVALCIILTIIVSITSGILLLFFSMEIGELLNSPEISSNLLFIPVVVLLSGFFSIFSYYMTRKKYFGTIATAQVTNLITRNIVQISAGIYNPTSLGLIAGLIIGNFSSLLIFIKTIKNEYHLFKSITFSAIKSQAIRYKRFPLFTSWSTTANTISNQITPMILAFYFNSTIVGYYSLANMIIFFPMSFIGQAIAQVFFQIASEEKNKTGDIKPIVRSIQQRLISFGMFPMFVLIIMGPFIFSQILGSQWAEAGIYAGILAPWTLLVFIASPLSTIFCILEKQTIDLTFNFLILISRVFVLMIGGLLNDPIISLFLYSITGVIFWGWMNMYLLKLSGINFIEGLKQYFNPFIISIVLLVPLVLINSLQILAIIKFIFMILLLCIHCTIIIKRDTQLNDELDRLFRGIYDIRYSYRK